jgi:hypothetical protein
MPRFLFLVVLSAMAGSSGAATVHRWVDADGVTHFSDTPPPSTQTDVETIEIGDDYSSASEGNDDYYSITNQWRRLNEERQARQQLSLERARLRAEQRPVPEEQSDDSYQPPRYIAYPYVPAHGSRVGRRGSGYGGFAFDNRRGFDRSNRGFDGRGVRRGDHGGGGGRRNASRKGFSLGIKTDLD